MTRYGNVANSNLGKSFAVRNYNPNSSRPFFFIIFLALVLLTASACTPLKAVVPLDESFPSYQSTNSERTLDDLGIYCNDDRDNNHTKHNVELIAPEERKQISEEILPFAQMSSNAYAEPKEQLIVLGWTHYGRYEDWLLGFGADVYVNDTMHNRAIAYRGTTPTLGGGLLDFLTANNTLSGRFLQYRDARKVFRKVRNSCRACKIIVTGHSLGGGLAAHISLKFKNVAVYTFNRTPLVFSKWFGKSHKGTRVDVEEAGEFLNPLRSIGHFFGKLKFWNKYEVNHTWRYNLNKGNAIKEHSIYNFAQCLKYKITEVS